MDGIDAALVKIPSDTEEPLEVVAFHTYPYDGELVGALRALVDDVPPTRLALLDVIVGEAFARAALDLVDSAGVDMEEVTAIGSHGQTVVHVPEPRSCAGAFARTSLQIGEPTVISERTGRTTVSGFRLRDMVAGGQGAPLVPLLDHRLYAHPELGRVALNVGGIANVTGLPPGAGLEGVVAFDTGPGNVLLDAVARARGIDAGYDRDGQLAIGGAVRPPLLERLRNSPFYQRKPPKSADTTDFLDARTLEILDEASATSDADMMATLTELTARTIAEAIERFIAVRQSVDEVLVSGGGVHNRALRGRLEVLLSPASVREAEVIEPAIPGDAKEVVLFALLAHETLAGRAGNVPAATGAAGPRVLGTIVPGV